MLRSLDQSSDVERSSLCRFSQDCIIAIRGYDFQEGQVSGDQNRRFTEKQIRGLLVRAAKERLISLDELHAEVAEKVRNDIEA